MTLVFQEDAYAAHCTAKVTSIDEGIIRLDRTVFYPTGGGQPGDTGRLLWEGGEIPITDTRKGESLTDVLHIAAEGSEPPPAGTHVQAEIDWARRYALMRMHTTLHLLCSLVPGDVTGGQIGAAKSRLDFNITGDQIDKDELSRSLNALVEADRPVRTHWIDAAELAERPDMVRTMSVKPPIDGGRVRLIEIAEVDLQPCGGTHVARTSEIGPLRIGKVESKGKQNRRINVHLATGD